MWSKTYSFSPSTTIKSAEVNQNFDDCISAVNEAVPSGVIMLWSGSVVSIPTGFYLCNGSNSTPDLTGRFIVGAGGAYNPADTGGEATHTLTEAEMPEHNHTITSDAQKWAGNRKAVDTTTEDATADKGVGFSNDTTTSANAGSGDAHENRPPYYSLAFIMKS